MKAEAWVFGILTVFVLIVTPIYWIMSEDPTGTTALVMTFFLSLLVAFYLSVTGRRMDARPEDRKEAEIADGAGELGFFPPYSWWPLWCAATLSVIVLGIVFGWWLFIVGTAIGIVTLSGWVFEYYRGDHAH
ncbi:cytochrome c oxidase subunit 4 [Streptomyces sp. SID13031]|uniref:cytochrome c oxidase subunit 4 n=1 Tax=Streptomyces sp. SID13031 TaxID=2706046 RepID=UPI0013C59CF4|nr:cytochrome c oxidase subunit 4 [Streptomyces sp. SID13031]NEA36691.1 cytochrome c oxidase subunit 4 [Streptomyces sp. SID13031]